MTPERAHLAHMPRLAALLWTASRDVPGLPACARPRLADLGAMARITRRGWVWFLRDSRGPAGFIARDGARIHALYVHPRAQGRGMGRALIEQAKDGAAWLELFVLDANLPARRFYAGCGFIEMARGRGLGNDRLLSDIRMVWRPA